MPNMSYCMFENTYSDLKECAEAIFSGKELSETEEKYKELLISLCSDICDDVIADEEDEEEE